MNFSISDSKKEHIFSKLQKANLAFQKIYPGDLPDRQPVHTVYGGADLFKYNTAGFLGEKALQSLLTYAPNFAVFGKIFRLDGFENLPSDEKEIETLAERLKNMTTKERKNHKGRLSFEVYNKVIQKLKTEAVEDFRIDFEDGFWQSFR